MNKSAPKVWFVTGCSKGFGYIFSELLARAGEHVFATARNVETLEPLRRAFPEQIHTAKLDIASKEDIDRAVQVAIDTYGHIDVLLNNAGFGVIGAIEAITDEQTRDIFNTNFFGTLNVTRAVLPHMRARRSGHIMQMSSSHAWGGGPGIGMYSASKCALEGATESMAKELEPLGIRVTILQPGPYKTDFLGAGLKRAHQDIEDYRPVTRSVAEAVDAYHGKQPGAPEGIVPAMLKVVNAEKPPLRLLLGKIATERAKQKIDYCVEEIDTWRQVSLDADFAA
jgi:NAD(P)-dependent dehydrogenase (short-subunit alcohol dehydrogenase family)